MFFAKPQSIVKGPRLVGHGDKRISRPTSVQGLDGLLDKLGFGLLTGAPVVSGEPWLDVRKNL